MARQSRGISRLLPAAHGGSRSALGDVLQACRNYLLWIARQELDPDLQTKAGASDLVQETLLEAQRDFGQFQGKSEAELLAWLRRLLLNNLSNFARSYRDTAKRRLDSERSLDADKSGHGAYLGLASAAPSPGQQAMEQEEIEIVHRVMDKLPEDYRKVLALWHEQECSFEEIGKQMKRSPNAARMLWVRAIERLQHELEKLKIIDKKVEPE